MTSIMLPKGALKSTTASASMQSEENLLKFSEAHETGRDVLVYHTADKQRT